MFKNYILHIEVPKTGGNFISRIEPENMEFHSGIGKIPEFDALNMASNSGIVQRIVHIWFLFDNSFFFYKMVFK